jgi:hypothetical protein
MIKNGTLKEKACRREDVGSFFDGIHAKQLCNFQFKAFMIHGI